MADLVDAVTAELFEKRVGQHDRHHRFTDDAGGGHCTHVAALDHGLDRFLRGEINRLQRRPEGGQRLHGGADDDRLPVGHAALEAARVVRRAPEAVRGVEQDLVVHARAGTAGRLEAETDLAALDRLDGAECLGQAPVQAPIPLHVRAEADRAAERDDLEHAAERIAFGLGVVDGRDDRRLGGRICTAHFGRLGTPRELVPRNIELADADAADLGDVAQDRDSDLAEQALGDAGHGHARRRLSRARSFEHVADVAVTVFHRSREVGMAWARSGDFLLRHAYLGRGDAHRRLPVLPVAVGDRERDRGAERQSPANAGDDVNLVALDLHPAAASVAALSASEIAVDVGFGQRHAGRNAVDDGRQRLTVGFSRGEEAEDSPHGRLAYREELPVCRPTRGASRRTRLGVTKITSSRLGFVWVSFDLKSQPRTGMSPKTGILRIVSVSVRCMMPPTTRVSPSLTSTSVSVRRLLIAGTSAPPPRLTRSPAELSSTMSFILIRLTLFASYTTVGVTSRRSAASLNWICVPAELTVA